MADISSKKERPPIRNVFACLVHESQECVIDLVRNLRYLDPSSVILLYNGGTDAGLLNHYFPFERYGVYVHPAPRLMHWGPLREFALDSMQFALNNLDFDTLTFVDSDQLGTRCGYSQFLTKFLSERVDVGMLGSSAEAQPPTTTIPPAVQALKEAELWRPFLRRFHEGESKYVHRTFWPSTVFTVAAARGLIQLFGKDAQLQDIMQQTRIWATEEIILPTLVALLGYKVVPSPCSYAFVKYRVAYSETQIDAALSRPELFWIHPVPLRCDDCLRNLVRERFRHYEKRCGKETTMPASQESAASGLLLFGPIIERIKRIDGWLEENEADLLIAVASRALSARPGPHAIVEVCSYCGRATTVLGSVTQIVRPETRVYAIDLFDGKVGALDRPIVVGRPTLEAFKRNIEAAGLGNIVEMIQQRSFDVYWHHPISVLLIDGFHDYASVARDFFHFERGLWQKVTSPFTIMRPIVPECRLLLTRSSAHMNIVRCIAKGR